MEPHVTVVWFVLPQWFQEMGAFLKEENIALAVDWAETAFKLFGELVSAAYSCRNACPGSYTILGAVAQVHTAAL